MGYPSRRAEQRFWSEGLLSVVGVDEVGCGALAGPVYAAAVVFEPHVTLRGLKESKQLTKAAREVFAQLIQKKAKSWSIGSASSEEIDCLGIRAATFLAMQRCMNRVEYTAVCVDGWPIPHVTCPQEARFRGDNSMRVVAAASVIAKVARDAYMTEVSEAFPSYGFAAHKGYGTAHHQAMIERYGLSVLHRKTFCKKWLNTANKSHFLLDFSPEKS